MANPEHLQILQQGVEAWNVWREQNMDITPDIPHREPDSDAFLSVKPHISLSQELKQVEGLVGQMEHEEPLARDDEDMQPHEGVKHPACRRVLEALAFVVWQGSRMLLEGGAHPRLQSGIHQPADGHYHQ